LGKIFAFNFEKTAMHIGDSVWLIVYQTKPGASRPRIYTQNNHAMLDPPTAANRINRKLPLEFRHCNRLPAHRRNSPAYRPAAIPWLHLQVRAVY
jgi:hypothetical protein